MRAVECGAEGARWPADSGSGRRVSAACTGLVFVPRAGAASSGEASAGDAGHITACVALSKDCAGTGFK